MPSKISNGKPDWLQTEGGKINPVKALIYLSIKANTPFSLAMHVFIITHSYRVSTERALVSKETVHCCLERHMRKTMTGTILGYFLVAYFTKLELDYWINYFVPFWLFVLCCCVAADE